MESANQTQRELIHVGSVVETTPRSREIVIVLLIPMASSGWTLGCPVAILAKWVAIICVLVAKYMMFVICAVVTTRLVNRWLLGQHLLCPFGQLLDYW